MFIIEAHDVRKSYGDTTAVAGIDLQVAAGEVVAVLGPNGAGKTTTIEMLLGIRRPDAGTIQVFGACPEDRAVRGRVGAMLQDNDAPDSLTVAEVIGLVGHYYTRALPTAYVLDAADLTTHRRHRVGQLSGGLRQRLSYALAIVGDPDLLFLDEPTAALDVAARTRFWAQVRQHAGRGRTVLFSTHYLQEAQDHADRVVVIHHGRVVQDGTPDQIRSTLAGTTVTMRTDLAATWFDSDAAVAHVDTGSAPADSTLGSVRVQTNAPETLLARVFATGARVEDLTVARADLETAFLHLTSDTAGTAATATGQVPPQGAELATESSADLATDPARLTGARS